MSEFLKLIKVSVYITLAIVVASLLLDWNGDFSWGNQLEYTAIYFVFSFVLTFVNSYYYTFISKKLSWETQTLKRLWFGAIGSIVITMVVFALLKFGLNVGVYGKSAWGFINSQKIADYMVTLIITIIASLFIHAFYFYKIIQDSKVKEQKIIAGTASAKFNALKNQLDPHFLFNSLNVLTSLIEEDPYKAQKFTTSLSKVYRYVLEQKNKDLVTVDEELSFAKTYVRLLKMRFEDSIVFDIPEKCSNSEAKIVPLSLQLLLENAVKHNVVTDSRPLHIKVYEEGGMLCVKNNLQEKQVVKKSSGVGLKNIQERYSILSNKKVIITKAVADFKVQLPMLSQQIPIMKRQEVYIEDKRYEKAREKVEAVKGFYTHLLTYSIAIPLMAYLNYRTTSFPWIIFPTLGWGFGVASHGMEAFGYNPIFGKKWEERKIREYMDKI